MAESKHTQGPWVAYSLQGGASLVPTPISFVSGPKVVIAGDGRTQGYDPVDAALIAAAPDLLEAAKRAAPVMKKNIYPKPDVGPDHPYSIFLALEAAIAKAENA